MGEVAIKVDGVYKDFALPHEKNLSLKSTFLQKVRGGRRTVERQHALKDISFEVKKGEFFGIVGRNGSGKSTLLKILAQIYKPTKGSVVVNGRLVPFIELGVGFNPELTGRDNVYLSASLMGFSRKEIDGMYNDIVDFAELEKFMDQKLKNYSSGMQVRLAFSIATRVDTDILLIDEVLAVGDADFQRKCFNYFKKLKNDKKTVVFISHDMQAVREYCDRCVLINDSVIKDIGSTNKITQEYTKLFSEKSIQNKSEKNVNDRWGTGLAKTQEVKVELTVNKVKITQTIKAYSDIKDGIIAGISIKNLEGKDIMGTNTKMEHLDLGEFRVNDEKTIYWEIPNIFSDGDYVICPAIVSNDSADVYDWWNEALNMTVKKLRHSPYIIDPVFKVRVD